MADECNHDWENDKNTTINTILREGDFIGFPVHCTICGAKAVEWFEYSYTEIEKVKE